VRRSSIGAPANVALSRQHQSCWHCHSRRPTDYCVWSCWYARRQLWFCLRYFCVHFTLFVVNISIAFTFWITYVHCRRLTGALETLYRKASTAIYSNNLHAGLRILVMMYSPNTNLLVTLLAANTVYKCGRGRLNYRGNYFWATYFHNLWCYCGINS
jgi:hypothetical protein